MIILEMDWYSSDTRSENTIMDDAVDDKEINKDEVKLTNINACRLYHGVVYPSEMLEYTGRTKIQGYLFGNGSYRKQHHKDWPYQPCPSDNQWVE